MVRRLEQGVLVVLWLAYFWMVGYVFYYGERHDFRAYFTAAQNILDGDSIYAGTAGSIAYLYPPLLAQGISGVARFASYNATALVWLVFNCVLLMATLWLLSRYFAEHKNVVWARRIWWLPLLFTPFLQSYWVGQVSVILLFCFAYAWILCKENRGIWAGALLALATWVKVFPVIVIGYFLWRRDWAVVKGALIAGFALMGVQLLGGFGLMLSFFTELLPELALSGKANPEPGLFKNSSLLGFSQKVFMETIDNAPLIDAPQYVDVLRYGLLAIMGGVTFFFFFTTEAQRTQRKAVGARRFSPVISYDRQFDLEYAIVLVLSLLMGSVLWVSSLPPIFLAYVLLLLNPPRPSPIGISTVRSRVEAEGFPEISTVAAKPRSRAQQVMTWLGWLSFAMLSFYFPMLLSRGDGVQWSWVVMSLGFWAVLLLWGLLLWQLHRHRY